MPELSRRRFLQTGLIGTAGLGLYSANLLAASALSSPSTTTQSALSSLEQAKTAEAIDQAEAIEQTAEAPGLQLSSSVKTDAAGHQLLKFSSNLERKAEQSTALIPSGWRGHQVANSPDGRYLVSVARRPGTQLLIQDLHSSTEQTAHFFIDADEERHFYGHGIFSADGQYLYCPENDYENAQGKIGVYDAHQGFKKVAEWDSQGVGPHQIAWVHLSASSDQAAQTLMVVANGGIETHPDYPRIKLNLDSMQPNISYLDLKGNLVQQVKPTHHQLSLRHLDVAPDGQVWVGAQYQGEVHESPNLIYSHHLGEDQLSPVVANQALWPQLKAYIASVSCHSQSDTVCITAPRDNLVTLWQRSTGLLLGQIKQADCAGVCAHPSLPYYFVSGGDGTLSAYHAETGDRLWQQHFSGIRWDNHLSWIS